MKKLLLSIFLISASGIALAHDEQQTYVDQQVITQHETDDLDFDALNARAEEARGNDDMPELIEKTWYQERIIAFGSWCMLKVRALKKFTQRWWNWIKVRAFAARRTTLLRIQQIRNSRSA